MKVTIEQTMGADAIATLYQVYAQAFDPIRSQAAARHLLTADEFTGEMLDERIDKYVVWDDDGRPVALTTLATDLAAVPWISADYYAAAYPEQTARKAVFYIGYTLIHPDSAKGIAGRIIAGIVRRMHDNAAVCGFDVSGHNDDVHQIGATMARLSRSLPVRVEPVDVQTYYVANFAGKAAGGAGPVAG